MEQPPTRTAAAAEAAEMFPCLEMRLTKPSIVSGSRNSNGRESPRQSFSISIHGRIGRIERLAEALERFADSTRPNHNFMPTGHHGYQPNMANGAGVPGAQFDDNMFDPARRTIDLLDPVNDQDFDSMSGSEADAALLAGLKVIMMAIKPCCQVCRRIEHAKYLREELIGVRSPFQTFIPMSAGPQTCPGRPPMRIIRDDLRLSLSLNAGPPRYSIPDFSMESTLHQMCQDVIEADDLRVNILIPAQLGLALKRLYRCIGRMTRIPQPSAVDWKYMSYTAQILSQR